MVGERGVKEHAGKAGEKGAGFVEKGHEILRAL